MLVCQGHKCNYEETRPHLDDPIRLMTIDVFSELVDYPLDRLNFLGYPYYPLLICYIAIEHGHRNSELSH